MDLLNFFQFLQILLAIFVVACLCSKGPMKQHCHVALVVLVISIMIIPPFGHNFLSAASMKEGATTPHENACKIGAMTIKDLINYPEYENMSVFELVKSLHAAHILDCNNHVTPVVSSVNHLVPEV